MSNQIAVPCLRIGCEELFFISLGRGLRDQLRREEHLMAAMGGAALVDEEGDRDAT